MKEHASLRSDTAKCESQPGSYHFLWAFGLFELQSLPHLANEEVDSPFTEITEEMKWGSVQQAFSTESRADWALEKQHAQPLSNINSSSAGYYFHHRQYCIIITG